MKSNSSRGRPIANDTSVQTLFMNVMAMHSKLVKYIQEQEDARVHYEGLQVNKVPRNYVPRYEVC
jgi:growth factor-regulated tyrosine kinase substrate